MDQRSTQGRQELLSIYNTIQQAWQAGQPATIAINGQTFTATPDVLKALKTGLGAEVLGLGAQVQQATRLDSRQASEVIGVPQADLQGLVSQYRTGERSTQTQAGDSFEMEDILPVMTGRQQEQSSHAR